MKKLIMLILSIGLVLSFIGCSSNSNTKVKTAETPVVKVEDKKVDNIVPKKVVVDKVPEIKLSDSAIKLTTDTLKSETLVQDVSIVEKDDMINIAIQVNAATNQTKSKDLVDTAIRQIGANSGGNMPGKDYYGQIWEVYNAHVRIFSGESTIILDGYMNKGSNKIAY